ncbi:MAG: hypothetical protein IJ403_01635 [Oscillospiraceae bacterium]|nr:hypothetical protein [Oscillospiraceae bacterium]
MLTPEYLLRVSEGGEAVAESLHNDIIAKIIDRIALRLDRGDNYILTAQDKWQIEVLQEAGFLLEDIQEVLVKSTGLMHTEIAEAMEDAGVKAISYDNSVYEAAGLSPAPLEQSPYLIRLMQRTYEATAGEWDNFTRTMADEVQGSFIRACNDAYMQVASGAIGYGQAFAEAVNSIVNDGVVVTYPSGHRDTIETATLRCIRTGVSQATAQITDARMEEMDWDIILVSSHLGARVTDRNDFTNHFWWQGKFYSRTGKDLRFPSYSVCGEGNVQGIHGANCRHSHGPGDGEFNPYEQYDSEKNRKEFELQQQQRAKERRIRESKRKVMGLQEAVDKAGTPEGKALVEKEYQRQAALLQKRNKDYNDFCEKNDLKKLNERITISKWDRKQAAQARAAARQREKELANPRKSGKMKIDTGGRRNEKPLTESQLAKAKESARVQGYDGDIFYRDTSSTSFHAFQEYGEPGAFHYLVIGTDAYPNLNARGDAVERISLNGCMAHEVVGHYNAWKHGTTQTSVPLEEAQASIRASKFGIGLTDKERAILLADGMNRLKDAGIKYDDVKHELDIWEP